MKKNPALWFSDYDRSFLRFDIVAGLTTAAVVIPKCLAYSVIAGLPLEVGLYTALVPLVVYALLGTSGKLSASTTTTIAILTAAELSKLGIAGRSPGELISAAATLAFLAGIFLVLAAVLRLGFLAYFISAPVLTGFKAGIGLVVILDQLPKLLGFHIDKAGFFRDIFAVFHHIPETHVPTLMVGGIAAIALFVVEKVRPRLPAPLFVVGAGIAVSFFLALKTTGVHVVGYIPAGLPGLSPPDLQLFPELWPGALGIALMSFTESIAASKAFAERGDATLNVNRELFALGAANMVGGLFQTMPAGGGTSQTAVNSQAGARTQVSGITTAVCTLMVMLFLSKIIAIMPLCILAAVVIVTTLPLINAAEFKSILRIRKEEFSWSVIACVGVMVLGTLNGILIAVAISVGMLMFHANHPPVYFLGRKKGTNIYRNLKLYPQDERIPGLLIVRTEGMLTFASFPHAADTYYALVKDQEPEVILLDLSAVPNIEYTALMKLEDFEQRMARSGTSLWIAGLNERPLKILERSALGERLKKGRLFYSTEEGVGEYLRRKGTDQ